jgi:hypothetical protein
VKQVMAYRNRFAEFIEQQREAYPERTLDFWAKRWSTPKRKLNPATIARWAKGDRRIGPNNRHVFKDLPFTMDEYYRDMPPSDQTQQRSDVRQYGRTRAKAPRSADIQAAGVVTVATAAKRQVLATDEKVAAAG